MPTSPWALKSQPQYAKYQHSLQNFLQSFPGVPRDPLTAVRIRGTCIFFFFFFAVASSSRCLATTLLQVIALQMVLLCWAYGFFPGHGNSSFFLHALESKPMIRTGQQSDRDHGGHVFPPMDPIFHGLLSGPSTESPFSFFSHKQTKTKTPPSTPHCQTKP